jgi:hypothetical protein
MSATTSSNIVFEPKVWSDHIQAYFDKKLVYGAFALKNYDLKGEGKGLTVNFPYYKAIGDAEEPAEDESLTVDNLSDDSFNATVFEVGKAVGIKKKAFKKSADSVNGMVTEAQRQMARVHAEKVDSKLSTEINASGNYKEGFLATAAADVMTAKNLLKAKISAFGDKQDDAVVCFMHSKQWYDMMADSTAGFLKADANDPLSAIKGFTGYIFNMAIVIVDTVTQVADIDGKNAFRAHFHKMDSFGIMEKQEIEMDEDKDILARERIFTSNQWYAVKSFHAKVASNDYKTGSLTTTVSF